MLEKLPKGVEVRTTVQALKRNVSKCPDRLALVAQSPIYGELRLTWKELDTATNKLANGLRELGIKKGDKVAMLLTNAAGVECYYTYLASHKLAAVNVPENYRLVGRELEYIFNHSDTACVVLEEQFAKTVEEIKPNLKKVRHFLIVGKNIPAWGLPFRDVYERGSDRDPEIEVLETDLADLLYTSGTTARPKGVMLPHATCIAMCVTACCAFRVRESDIFQDAIPFYTGTGCKTLLNPHLYKGIPRILEPVFDVEKTLQTMEKERTTVYFGVPAMLIFLLEHPGLKKYDTSSLRLFGYGGSVMPVGVIKRLGEAFPGVGLMNAYGLTEGGPGGSQLDPEFALTRAGAIGYRGGIPPWTKLRLVDENDEDVAIGEIGEIVLRSPSVMEGYYRDPEATAEALKGGWLHTGDLGRYDEDGFVYFVDRKKDIIVRGGFNISSIEVEEILYEHPAVLEAAVVPKPHPRLVEDVLAFVVLKSGAKATPKEITEFCRSKLADFKVPRDVRFIEAIPRNPHGKIDKKLLRDEALKAVEKKEG